MFVSFFPRPRLLLSSFVAWALFCVLAWYLLAKGAGPDLSLGDLFGYGFPAAPGTGADDAAKAAFKAATDDAMTFWFYQYFIAAIGLFTGSWMFFARHPWQRWSVGGSALMLFINGFLVELDVRINDWFGSFYDLVQKALGKASSVEPSAYYLEIATFLKIALVYVIVATVFRFFVSHFIFRWRTAMNAYYTALWDKLRHIEGAAQRVQEDTMRFASISEDLGASLMDSLMTLIAFLPLLWALSAHVRELPIVGPVSQGLVFVAIFWSIIGTTLVAVAGMKLPGLQFRNQRVEAAYRKELVYGEDHAERAQPATLRELFQNVRKNYFRLYFHYLYFNVVRISYLQVGALVPYIALGPAIIGGSLTLGIMQQIVRAFGRVESSFQYLVNSWTTIIELLSIHKRLKAFEATLAGEPLPDIDRRYLEQSFADP
ncbi:peptide antibiotic transporter SbmA [Marinobacter halodurans]|uniref:Peptide antibiotic transporter SbmA n=1 Tax=Marinobacter halodurans TaxID=2528979 RepID=A0ABY1ZJ73_9GAMM|nr:peptide antibiotic transporter SbmA [Marinobacter halodurans]TBW49374.1 peptide antibiotic transporter SbmA [Marinobacter halodurans]